jgi:hypothetical protein
MTSFERKLSYRTRLFFRVNLALAERTMSGATGDIAFDAAKAIVRAGD